MKIKKKNILIIGGNGFIGSHLTASLNRLHQVTVFDKSQNHFIGDIEGVNYIYGDFNDLELLSRAIQDKDIVYHLLSTTIPYTADQNPVFDVDSNLIGTLKLLELIVQLNVPRFVYVSSGGTVYGKPAYLPIDEKHPCHPLGSYGIVKNTIEKYIENYALRYNFSYLIARPSNPYGPRQNYRKNQGLMAKLIYNGLIQEEFTVWGDGSAVRDYIYIDDLTNFLHTAGLSHKDGVFNVGAGLGLSVNEVIKALSAVVDQMPKIIYTTKNKTFVDKVYLDTTKARQVFSWEPQTSLESGLRSQYKWIKNYIESVKKNFR